MSSESLSVTFVDWEIDPDKKAELEKHPIDQALILNTSVKGNFEIAVEDFECFLHQLADNFHLKSP